MENKLVKLLCVNICIIIMLYQSFYYLILFVGYIFDFYIFGVLYFYAFETIIEKNTCNKKNSIHGTARKSKRKS